MPDCMFAPRLKLNDRKQRKRGETIDKVARERPKEARKAAKRLGVHGSTIFARLPYLDLQNVWMVPLCHALLYGVVKDFVAAFLDGG